MAITNQAIINLIGLRENVQETTAFTMTYNEIYIIGVSCKFSLKPIQWRKFRYTPYNYRYISTYNWNCTSKQASPFGFFPFVSQQK